MDHDTLDRRRQTHPAWRILLEADRQVLQRRTPAIGGIEVASDRIARSRKKEIAVLNDPSDRSRK